MNKILVQEINRLHAEFCSGLADPKRLMIIYSLADGSHNVSELSSSLGLSQPAVSRHLKILRDRGLVQAERDGQTMVYRLMDARVIEALELLRAVMASVLQSQAALANSVEKLVESE